MPVLTVAAIRKLAPQTKRREIRDTQAPGLRLVIQPRSTDPKFKNKIVRSWAMRFRRPDGRGAKLTLGPYVEEAESGDAPVIGGPLTLVQARELAAKIARQRASGKDVVEERKVAKKRTLNEALDRKINSFAAVAHKYIVDHKTRKWGTRPRRWREDALLLGLEWERDQDPSKFAPEVVKGGLCDTWANKPLAEIDVSEIHTLIEEAEARAPSRARKLRVVLSGLFRWAVKKRKISSNPVREVEGPKPPAARERVLTDEEIRKFWKACDKLDVRFATALKVLLLTGQRRNEVVGMRADELKGDVWEIPSHRSKNHRAHLVPLSPLVKKLLDGVPRVEGGFVFSTTGHSPISGWSKSKRTLDEAMGADDWVIHDLRRTVATGMGEINVRHDVIELCLNHISGTRGGVAGTYNKSQLFEERKEAMKRWALHVQGLLAADKDKVVQMKKSKRA